MALEHDQKRKQMGCEVHCGANWGSDKQWPLVLPVFGVNKDADVTSLTHCYC